MSRRAELESDVWEQRQMAVAKGEAAANTAIQIWMRLMFGIPADVAWRLRAGAAARQGDRVLMKETWIQKTALMAGVGLATFPLLVGITLFAGNGDFESESDRLVFGGLTFLFGAIIVAGLLMSRRSPRAGPAMVALGAIGLSIFWYWVLFLLLPVGAGLVAIAYARGRNMGWPRGTGTA